MDRLIDAAVSNWFWSVLGTLGLAAIIFGSIKQIILMSARERTRRDVAAYIAEGSMTPEQGERLMRVKLQEDDD